MVDQLSVKSIVWGGGGGVGVGVVGEGGGGGVWGGGRWVVEVGVIGVLLTELRLGYGGGGGTFYLQG